MSISCHISLHLVLQFKKWTYYTWDGLNKLICYGLLHGDQVGIFFKKTLVTMLYGATRLHGTIDSVLRSLFILKSMMVPWYHTLKFKTEAGKS